MPLSLAALSSSSPPRTPKLKTLNPALAIALLVCTAAILALAGARVINNRRLAADNLAGLGQPVLEDLEKVAANPLDLATSQRPHWSPYMSIYLTLLLSLLLCVMFFLLIIFECHSWVSLPAVIIALIVICTAPHPPSHTRPYPPSTDGRSGELESKSIGFWPELEEIGTVCAFLYTAALLAATVSTLCCRWKSSQICQRLILTP